MATAGRTTGRTAAGHDDDFQPLAMRRVSVASDLAFTAHNKP